MSCLHKETPYFEVCSQCEQLKAPEPEAHFFEIYGQPVAFEVDVEAINSRYYELSRTLHPDKFFGKSAELMDQANLCFALVSKARGTLISPLKRAQYLLSLAKVAGKSSQSLPPDMIGDYFELQENLEDSAIAKEQRLELSQSFSKRIQERVSDLEQDMKTEFVNWQTHGAQLESENAYLKKASSLLDQHSYMSSMARDLENRCQSL